MPKEQQEFRALFRLRQAKVKDMSRAINRLKGFLLYFGINYSSNFEGYISANVITWLRKLRLASEAGNLSLKKYIDDLVYQRSELAKVTKIMRSQAKKDYAHQYKCLLSVPGIGFTTAIGLLAEIGDFNRFKNPAEYCSFLGLIPWQHSSGDSIQVKGIHPRCNKILRPLLVEASWFAIRNDPSLLKYYRKHAVKNSRHAIIKVTRKLALIAKGSFKNCRCIRLIIRSSGISGLSLINININPNRGHDLTETIGHYQTGEYKIIAPIGCNKTYY